MATTVGQHGVAAFTNPSNGDALDATVVKANDNTLRDAYVTHDDDSGIHLQSSTLASRPAAGTAGRKWLTTDTGSIKVWYDNGSTWEEISYIQSSGTVTLPSDLSVGGNATITGDGTINGNVALGNATTDTVSVTGRVNTSVVPSVTATNDLGTTSLRWRDLYVGSITTTGTVTANTFSGSGASLTGIAASGIAAGTFSGLFTFANPVTFNSSISASSASISSGVAYNARTTPTDWTGSVSVTLVTANNTFRARLTGNTTATFGTGSGVSTFTFLYVEQDGTGGRTLTWSGISWPGGTAPTQTSTAGRGDLYLIFQLDGSTRVGVRLAADIAL